MIRSWSSIWLVVGFGFIALTWPVLGSSQKSIVITGTVVDGHDDEPIPLANIYLPEDPTVGVSADFDGKFELTLDIAPDSLEVSALGYITRRVAISSDKEMWIKLDAMNLELAEVVIAGNRKEDPAYALMRKVVANKPLNDPAQYPQYKCEVYNKMEVDLINISEEFMQMRINKPFAFVYNHIDSTSDEEPFLPLFVSEALADLYVEKDPKRIKEDIKAVKVVGDVDNESFGQLLGVAKAQLNVYDNWLDLVSKKFASPIADNGKALYRYYLIDSTQIDGHKCYQIQFFPRHKGINGFTGDFWIQDSTYAVRKAKLQLAEESHLNFVEKLTIVQEYVQTEKGRWVPKKDFITISSTTITEPFLPKIFKKLRENAPGVQAKRQTTYENFVFDKNLVEAKIDQELGVREDAFNKDEEYWEENRHIELEDSEKTAYYLIDTIRSLPVIQIWEKVTTALVTGYMWGDYVDIGNVYEFFSQNPIEGFRTKFGLRTAEKIHEDIMLGGYAAYGWDDRNWKFGADLLYVMDRKPWRTLSVAYIDDYSPAPNFNPFFSQTRDGLGSNYFLRRRSIPLKLMNVQHFSVSYFEETSFGLSARVTLSHQQNEPLFNFSYPIGDGEGNTRYSFGEVAMELRYAFDEVILSGNYLRSSLGSKYPIVSARYARGITDLLGGDIAYDELQLTVTDRVRWGALGYTNMRLTGGAIWGTVPYLNLFIPQGNEGIFMNRSGLNVAPEYVFAADRYVFVALDHHFDGAILQLVPLFRKMRLRSVADFRMLYGSMTETNRASNKINLAGQGNSTNAVQVRIPDMTPYMEASTGIENIFRFFSVHAVWRLNYREVTGSPFGVRTKVVFNL